MIELTWKCLIAPVLRVGHTHLHSGLSTAPQNVRILVLAPFTKQISLKKKLQFILCLLGHSSVNHDFLLFCSKKSSNCANEGWKNALSRRPGARTITRSWRHLDRYPARAIGGALVLVIPRSRPVSNSAKHLPMKRHEYTVQKRRSMHSKVKFGTSKNLVQLAFYWQ